MSDPTNLAVLLGGMAVLAVPSIACAVRARQEADPKTRNRFCLWTALMALPAFIAVGFVLEGFAGGDEPITLLVGITGTLLMFAIAKGKREPANK